MARLAGPLPPVTTDPTGELHGFGMPVYLWGQAPAGLLTYRQLAARGLRPNGQPPAAMVRRRRLFAYLYRVDRAAARRPMTAAKCAAIAAANRARYRCCGPCGRVDLDYIPRQAAPCFGLCWDCFETRPI